MRVTKTVKLTMTEVEKGAVKIVYRMLNDLERDEERTLANELDWEDLEPLKYDLCHLYELSGECEADLH